MLILYTNQPDGNLVHKHKTIKFDFPTEIYGFPLVFVWLLNVRLLTQTFYGNHLMSEYPADSRQNLKLSGNGRKIVGQQITTLLGATCCGRLHNLLHVVAQSLKPVKLLSH